ncbi:hypothetical protein H0H92_013283, partial [Tricholoma furcatifolium]
MTHLRRFVHGIAVVDTFLPLIQGIPWSQLTHIILDQHPLRLDSVIEILQNCIQLEHAFIEAESDSNWDSTGWTGSTVYLPHLTRLGIVSSEIEDPRKLHQFLTAPNLEYMSLSLYLEEEVADFKEFFLRSGGQLRTLDLGSGELTTAALQMFVEEILASKTNISSLSLSVDSDEAITLVTEFVERESTRY